MKTLLFCCIFIIGCSTKQTENTQFNKLIYEFHDSSVSPEYHRSFTITISTNKIEKLVHSYGDTISFKTKTLEKIKFEHILTLFKKAKIINCIGTKDETCDGGTSVNVFCFNSKKEVFNGSIAYCGGETTGNMKGNLNILLTGLTNLIDK